MIFTEFTDPRDFVIEGSQSAGPKNQLSTPKYDDPTSVTKDLKEDDKVEAGTAVAQDYRVQSNKNLKEDEDIILNNYDLNNPRDVEVKRGWSEYGKKAIAEYMDMYDDHTVNVLAVMNEAEQNSLLLSLTNKLYGMIVNKIDSIDFGEIPNTRGDVTRLRHYDQLRECHKVLRQIFEQFHENDEPVDTIEFALDNLENHKELFVGAFAAKAEFPMSVYKTITLAVINATSFMIAVCVEYIKSPKNEGLEIVLNKTGVAKVKDHLVYESLKDWNEACRKGDVENALRPFVQNKAKGFAFTAALGFKTVLVLGGVCLALLPIIKDLVYFFFAARARVSSYFDLQAKLLEMNADELKNSNDIKTVEDKDKVIRRQLQIAKDFHEISDFIAVDAKTSEIKANNDIKKDKQEYKIDDVEPEKSDGGPLF